MEPRSLINLVLLLAVAGLAAFIAFAPENKPAVELEPLSDENPRAVSHIRLDLGQGGIIELRRSEGVWQLVDPLRIAANDFRVSTLLAVLGAPVHARIDARPGELSKFGLASPQARLRLDEIEILFGDTEPIYGRRYLLFDRRVVLVDDAYYSHLSSSAANFVNPAPLGRNPRPRDILLPGLRIYRDSGQWRMEPEDTRVDADAITKLVDAWRNAQATAVRPYEESLDWNDEIRIQLPNSDLRFDLARTEYELILGRPDLGIQYHLTRANGARLLDIAPADNTS